MEGMRLDRFHVDSPAIAPLLQDYNETNQLSRRIAGAAVKNGDRFRLGKRAAIARKSPGPEILASLR